MTVVIAVCERDRTGDFFASVFTIGGLTWGQSRFATGARYPNPTTNLGSDYERMIRIVKRWKNTLLAAASVSMGLSLMPAVAMAATTTVTVQPGDSLWKIASAYHVSLQSLEASNPTVNPSNLLIGTRLNLPQSQSESTYRVQPGDSFFLIAKKYGTTTAALQSANPGIYALNLQVGQVLRIPGTSSASTSSQAAAPMVRNTAMSASPASSSSPSTSATSSASAQDVYWMSRIIYAEAGNQSLQAQIAVGDVVWHRVTSPNYPNTIKGVVFQISNGYYQFSPVANGSIYNTPSATSVQAAKDVLQNHIDLVPGAYVFYTPNKTPSTSWVRKQPYVATYDSMVFSV
jgi:N-acetylmuramoyl-L-alanine amidase